MSSNKNSKAGSSKSLGKSETFLVRKLTARHPRAEGLTQWAEDSIKTGFLFHAEEWMRVKGEKWASQLEAFLKKHIPQ